MGQPVVPTKWRMIHNGSRGKNTGTSVNCGISAEDATVHYVTFDDVLDDIRKAGKCSTVFKSDIKEAFKHLSVHPDDIPLQGIFVGEHLYLETRLVFGLRTSPKIFSRLAECLRYVFATVAVCPALKNMLDDFFNVEPGRHTRANHMILPALLTFFDAVGLPWAAEKTEAPNCVMTVLGFEVDTLNMTYRVPEKRMAALRTQLPLFKNKTIVTKNELARLVGVLSWCSFSVRNGRTFLRRLIDLMTSLPTQLSTTLLDEAAKADIEWWIKFAPIYNGTAKIIDPTPVRPIIHYSDSSLPTCAGVWGDKWWSYNFTEQDNESLTHISAKELFAVVCNCRTFNKALGGATLMVYCDNLSSVEAINRGRCRDPVMMKLIRELFYLRAEFSFQVRAIHTPGETNSVADALSRNKEKEARCHLPSLDLERTVPNPPTMLW
jgi:hypothetical protein